MPEPTVSFPLRACAGIASRLWGSAYLLLIITVLLWSGNIIVGRAAHENVPPIALTFWRWTLALVVVMPFAWRHVMRDRAVLLRSWKVLVILSITGISAYNAFAYSGLASTTAVNAALLQSALSPIILVWGLIVFRDRPGWMQIFGVGVSLVGVALIVAKGSPEALFSLRLNPGDGLVLTGLMAYGLYSVVLKVKPIVHPLSFLAVTFALGALFLLPFYAVEVANGRLIRLVPASALAIVYVGLFPSLIAYLCFNRGVELIGAGRAGQFIHLMPVFASLLAVIFLGEHLRLYHLIGAAIIGLGIVIASRRPVSDVIERT